jgi:glucokinase
VDKNRGSEGIREQICAAIPKLTSTTIIEAVGVGFGGPVNWRHGKVCCSHQIKGWADFDLGAWLNDVTSAPVRVENDANTGCLGEALLGAGKGRNPVFYVTLGSGVGGGLVANGSVYHGATPAEAEIGHVRLARNGTIVEDRCSGWAVDRRIKEAIQNYSGELSNLCKASPGCEARHLAAALKKRDPLARKILTETAEDLAFGLSHVVHLCHPEIIVLGGGLSLLGDPLKESVATALRRFIMDAFQPGPIISLAALGEDAVPCGALLLAKQLASL